MRAKVTVEIDFMEGRARVVAVIQDVGDLPAMELESLKFEDINTGEEMTIDLAGLEIVSILDKIASTAQAGNYAPA